jgi:hypothetical protein
MRHSQDRRQPHHYDPNPVADNGLESTLAERRKTADRRKENLSLEERQCLFSEMPAPPSDSS